MNKLREFKQHAAAVKLERLVVKQEERKRKVSESVSLIVDPGQVHPDKFIGLTLKKDFDGFGIHEGRVIDHDTDMMGEVIYSVRYVDGDQEDMFLAELVGCVDAQEMLLHINK